MLGGEAHGTTTARLLRPARSDSDDPQGVTFAESEGHALAAESSGVGAVILGKTLAVGSKPAIIVERPREAFAMLLHLCHRPVPLDGGISSQANVHIDAVVDPGASIGAFAVVERGARVSSGARIYSFAYVGENCEVGEGSQVMPHAVLLQDVRVGARCIIHPGAVLGADGFGFAWDGQQHRKIPQVGGVVIGDNVEIGALTAIDRATAGVTAVGNGTKIDNLVQVAHNVGIGSHSVIASQTGIAGSAKVGNRVTMGGQCAIADHRSVADDVLLAGQTGVAQDIKEPGAYWGIPAAPIAEARRRLLVITKLPELFQRLKALERERK
jgi:UDP-3-O-[3-hydroxymyristoyl] glucosamine N-acyltransferase